MVPEVLNVAKPSRKKKPLVSNQKAELQKLIDGLISFELALYHPESKKIFTTAGFFPKKDCSDKKRLEKVKLLLPDSCRTAFCCSNSAGRIGKIIICLDHFYYVHQKQFIIHGSFPENVQLKKLQSVS